MVSIKTSNQVFTKDNINDILNRAIFLVLGNLISAIGINGFLTPNKLLTGGVGGVGIIVQYLTSIPSGIMVFFINIPMIIIGLFYLDKKTVAASFVSGFAFSFFLTLTTNIGEIVNIKDPMLGAITGGVIYGVGMGIMTRNKVLQGGFEVIAAVIKKKTNINIGSGLIMMNVLVLIIASLLFGLKPGLYTVISVFMSGIVLDKVQKGFNTEKIIIITSEKYEEIASYINKNVKRKVTLIDGVENNTTKKIMCSIVLSNEVAKVKEIVKVIDNNALLVISDTLDVSGSEFRQKDID